MKSSFLEVFGGNHFSEFLEKYPKNIFSKEEFAFGYFEDDLPLKIL